VLLDFEPSKQQLVPVVRLTWDTKLVIQFHPDLKAVSMPMTCTQIQETPMQLSSSVYSLTWLSGLNATLATVPCMGAFGGDLRGCSVCISCAAACSEISV